jgi:dinuclear metal center YbgI/SA1388 family protein
MTASRATLVKFLDDFLHIQTIKDSSCNGLQVQGIPTVARIGLAVDACMASYEKAVAQGCEMLIVHHGLIWHGIKHVSGHYHDHLAFTLGHGLNLYAAHLPLDVHPKVGNNIQLAKMLGLKKVRPFGVWEGEKIGFAGELSRPVLFKDLSTKLENLLDTKNVLLPFGKKRIKTIGVVSGGASHELKDAIGEELDCYITGEPSHEAHHSALEAKINVIFAGHYATETAGLKALGNVVRKKFGLPVVFLEEPTIV